MKPKVFLTRGLPAEPMRVLRERTQLGISGDKWPLAPDELIAGVRGCDGLLCMLTDTINATVMDAAPRLKVIANYAVGYDNIDVGAAKERGVWICHTPGVLSEATADLAFTLLLFFLVSGLLSTITPGRLGRFSHLE